MAMEIQNPSENDEETRSCRREFYRAVKNMIRGDLIPGCVAEERLVEAVNGFTSGKTDEYFRQHYEDYLEIGESAEAIIDEHFGKCRMPR